MTATDRTHDPARRSWVESANDPDCDFPIQNLPWGVFRGEDGIPRIGIAIGDQVLDVQKAILGEDQPVDTSSLGGVISCALCAPSLNQLMGLGREAWRAARHFFADLLDAGSEVRDDLLHPMADVELLLPATIGDYTDFYASRYHATNVGRMFRPDGEPLMPNYLHLPVGYHGRASSIVVSGTEIRRPHGQLKPDDADPVFAPIRLLDYELEFGAFIGEPNDMGTRVPIDDAMNRLFGLVILNDWSARDVQKWEYQPLGPFNAKNFGTTLSPWIVTLDALEPFMVPGPRRGADDPTNLDYLTWADDFGVDLNLTVEISSEGMREQGIDPTLVSRGNYADMYWTMSQMLAHHTSTGCPLRPGDIYASGTVSGETEDSRGCLLERTWRGQHPITLGDGTERKFLQDGDEVIINGWCEREGARRIGFGACSGVVAPALEPVAT